MELKEAMESRHTVRSYTDRKLPKEIVEQLMIRINENNEKYGLHMKLAVENMEAFGAMLKLIWARGVRNYIILAGEDTAGIDEKLGYCGADVMLFAQMLGLNTWWVGGTFNKKRVKKIWAAPALKNRWDHCRWLWCYAGSSASIEKAGRN